MWKAVAILSTAVLLVVASKPAIGQIPANWPAIVATVSTECGDAPEACQGASAITAPGSFDAFVYIEPWWHYYSVAECALGVAWPADWSVVAELCAGSIVEGTLDNLQDGIRVAFTPCVPSNTALLHLTVNATSSGRLELVPGPNHAFGDRYCQGNFEPYFGRGAYVDVGNVCGGYPMGDPCDQCTLHYGDYEPSATFDPPSWEVTVRQGETAAIRVHASGGGECEQIPECRSGFPFPQSCGGTLLSQVPWLTIEWTDGEYEARVDTGGLLPGMYYGGGEVEGHHCCASACWPVELTIGPPLAMGATTWGEIKAVYR